MAWSTKKGFNFRDTGGFVTDGTNQVGVYGFWGSATYPTTTSIGGEAVTYGFESSGSLDLESADINSSAPYAPELSGEWRDGALTDVFRVDLPASGNYTLTLAAGAAGGGGGDEKFEIRDNSTARLSYHALRANGSFVDATGTDRGDAAAWRANQAPTAYTFASTIFRCVNGGNSFDKSSIAHIALEAVGGGGPVGQPTMRRWGGVPGMGSGGFKAGRSW
jgi:hypothetical protein